VNSLVKITEYKVYKKGQDIVTPRFGRNGVLVHHFFIIFTRLTKTLHLPDHPSYNESELLYLIADGDETAMKSLFELYSIWGHTAIRVIDSSSGMDVAFNYGTFDNSDPYFYLKFTRGIMQYALSVDNYNIFLQEYKQDHRSVIEQKLMLNGEQKERLFKLLNINALEENRYYNYRFYEDNCTTRAKGIINKSTHNSIIFKNILTGKAPTYRELIHKNLDSYHQYWSRFAIDFLLGSNLDKQINIAFAPLLIIIMQRGYLISSKDRYAPSGPPTAEQTQYVQVFI